LKLLLEVLSELKISIDVVNAPDLYFRMHEDIATLSIDTTGEHLHFRGYRQLQGEAPLRENFAAFVWSMLIEDMSLVELADYHIIDPMAGSGTMLFESLLWDKQIICRKYTSTAWLESKTKDSIKNYWEQKPFQSQVWGFDNIQEIIKKAQENYKFLQKFYPQVENKVQFQFFDLFDKNLGRINSEVFKKKRLLLSNPPYGERLHLEKSCMAYCERALEVFVPEKAIFLVPDKKETRSVKRLGQYNKVKEYPFLNNGIRVLAQKWVICQKDGEQG
jgi:putative N6-adenine-specific DNA methylase